MKQHIFRVFWETQTRTALRHYSREFQTESEAVALARKKEQNPLINAIIVSEIDRDTDAPFTDEYGVYHPNGCRKTKILRNIKWWE